MTILESYGSRYQPGSQNVHIVKKIKKNPTKKSNKSAFAVLAFLDYFLDYFENAAFAVLEFLDFFLDFFQNEAFATKIKKKIQTD